MSTPTVAAWKKMIYRCTDPCNPRWDRYGGAGIRVYQPWLDSYEAFREDMGRRPDGHVLARRDSTGDFTPDNCYWMPRTEAARKFRATAKLSYNGETLLLTEWSERTGLTPHNIRNRLRSLGWSVGQALGLEPRQATCGRPAT